MPDYQKELVEYRLQTAQEKLHSAKILLDAGEYKDSIGRSYYSMFSAIRAILALDKVLDGELRETQTTDYFSKHRRSDCAVRELTAR